ncbi:MAG TPA: group II intron reverse transcriptase/maturase [candidate division WOR-3 bacterium]|uniref:CRISPR-associated endonuclease Cas1 n=1 Tax=candidate division WOR-3 bacterium TaxID=2052148 RepID=A0A7V0T5M9_UNCW3|nr:group II intron reverse transcriptase/maturase [candidate division WOR-3 bacterium]
MTGHFFRRVCDLSTLHRAWTAVRANRAGPGADEVSLAEFERTLARNLQSLSRALAGQSYVPEPLRQVYIPKSDGRKRRLSIPSVRDRIAQQAVKLVIEPLFEGRFLSCSYGYRPGRGPQRAVEQLESLISQGLGTVARADIAEFFDSISHELLLRLVRQRVWEPPVLRLIELWLRSGAIGPHGWSDGEIGVAQGGVISPLLANIYLHEFDWEMVRRRVDLVRYADDFIIAARDRPAAERALADARHFLNSRLALKLGLAEVRHVDEGFCFLGFRFHPGGRSIAPEKVEKVKHQIIDLLTGSRDLPGMLNGLNRAIRAWREYYGSCDCTEQFRFLERFMLRELARQMKSLDGLDRSESRRALAGLELFLPRSAAGRTQVTALVLAEAGLKPMPRAKAKPRSVGNAVALQRRRSLRELESRSVVTASRPGLFLGRSGRRLVVRERGRKELELPLARVKHVLVASNGVAMSSDLVRACAEAGIPLVFLDERGRPGAWLLASSCPLYSLTGEQFEARRTGRAVEIARAIVRGKVTNQMNLLRYYGKYRGRRESGFRAGLDEAVLKMKGLLARTAEAEGQSLFALEGQSAAVYWSLVKELLASDACFEHRAKKGATDLVNSLLNYGYGVLYARLLPELVLAGLNPGVGMLHVANPGRPALLFDMVEEFRQPAVDRAVFALVRRRTRLEMKDDRLAADTRRRLVDAISRNLAGRVYYDGHRLPLAEVMTKQVRRLAAAVKGKQNYEPFVFH